MRTIRARVQDVCLWLSGLLLASAGWLIATETALSVVQTIALLLALVLIVVVLIFVYLADLRKGFKAQQKVAARIESALKLYDHKFYDDHQDGIYPATWKDAGGKAGKGGYFGSSYWLIFITAAFLCATIGFKGYESSLESRVQDQYRIVGRTVSYNDSSDANHDLVRLELKHGGHSIQVECDLKVVGRLDRSASCALHPLREYQCALGTVDLSAHRPRSDLECKDANGHNVYLSVRKVD